MCPMMYNDTPGAVQTTNATPNTANDCFFAKPGTARSVAITSVSVIGRAASATSITGLAFRLEKWGTTSSSGGTGITPTPKDPGMQAAKHTAGYATATVTSGSGGPTLGPAFGCGAAGPGGFTALNPDAVQVAEAGANHSWDIFNVSAAASMNFEMGVETVE